MLGNNLICIIEDNLPIRKLFSTLLKKSGFLVEDFDNASDGINWLNANKPSIVLLDILLPDMNGADAIKIIRQINGFENIPVVAITGFAGEMDKEKYLAIGFNHYMTKPVNVSTFVSEVSKFIKQ